MLVNKFHLLRYDIRFFLAILLSDLIFPLKKILRQTVLQLHHTL